MSHPVLGCIADDFTGATDLANNLVLAGMRVVQTVGVPTAALSTEADAVVVALKSRTIAPEDAVDQSVAALTWLRKQGAEQIYFKYCSTFDSTSRGNIGPVTDALLDVLEGQDRGFTIACPAFPTNGRTVFNGHLFVGEQLLDESGMQHHPLTPMTDSNLVRVMQAQSRRKVGLVGHAVVAAGADAIRARFEALRAQSIGIAIVDAVSNRDLMEIGTALARMPLVTAASGIALGLPQNWRYEARSAGWRPATFPDASGYRAILSGSCSTASNLQVQRFQQAGLPSFAIDPLALAAGADVVAEALAWAEPLLARGPVLIYATASPQAVAVVQAELGAAHAGSLIEHALSALAGQLVQRSVRQLLVAGGETSGAVVQALGIREMSIGPQIEPGVPWTAATTPLGDGQPVHLALKSGNFGAADFFIRAFDRLDVASGAPSPA